ncbi:MAG: SMC-Scp complex subunit ScpB [Bdellovibrionales bacterium]|nr:SMC-Scp complex subunit ScpB [Bdellovibrionales bacterium]
MSEDKEELIEDSKQELTQEELDFAGQGEPDEEEFEISAESADAPEDFGDEDVSDEEGFDVEGTELEDFESAEIVETEFLATEQIQSIVESVLFATEKPQSLSVIKQAFKGTQVRTKDIKAAIQQLSIDYASGQRGFSLEEVNGGYQLRTKIDNMDYLKRMVKSRPFKLSGPALEVMSIVAYKQPLIKAQIDEIRGVESGHLLRALMEKHLVAFAGKSEFPGKPMLYQTTRKFLEIFGLRNLKELPSLSEIDDLIPEGIGEEEEKETLGDITENMSEEAASTYSEGEEELLKITEQLSDITTSSDFFEQEKARQKAKRDSERAQDIRDALAVGEDVADKDKNWLARYEERLALETTEKEAATQNITEQNVTEEANNAVDEAVSEDVSQEEIIKASTDEIQDEDSVGELESNLEEALERFDKEDTKEGFVGSVDVAQLKSDLDVFDEEMES